MYRLRFRLGQDFQLSCMTRWARVKYPRSSTIVALVILLCSKLKAIYECSFLAAEGWKKAKVDFGYMPNIDYFSTTSLLGVPLKYIIKCPPYSIGGRSDSTFDYLCETSCSRACVGSGMTGLFTRVEKELS
jgi:hypothetical protein